MEVSKGEFNALPTELLCEILRLAINPRMVRRDRCRICLVCRLWWQHVDGSALLWTDISGQDSPTYVRRALEKSKGAMIDLRYGVHLRAEMNLEAFLAEAAPHIARWRSLMVEVRSLPQSWDGPLAPLATLQVPSLESLTLSLLVPGYPTPQSTIRLFSGGPAPPTLKNLTLPQVQVIFEPLSLSGMVSLALKQVATISTPQLLEILRSSPCLETLELGDCPGLVAIGPQPSVIQPIALPKFVSLSLKGLDHGGTNYILSAIRIPNRRRIYIYGDMIGISARSILFTSTIAHILHPATPSPSTRFSDIKLEVEYDDDCTIQFRGIELDLLVEGEDQIQGILGWLADSLGSEAAACPVQLILDWSELDPVRLAAVPSPLVVKHLSISESWFGSFRESLCVVMFRPPESTSSGWLLAQMESLSVGFDTVESQREFISMLRSRYGEASSRNETESRRLVNLRSVELRGQPKTEGLIEEIVEILGEADVFWTK